MKLKQVESKKSYLNLRNIIFSKLLILERLLLFIALQNLTNSSALYHPATLLSLVCQGINKHPYYMKIWVYSMHFIVQLLMLLMWEDRFSGNNALRNVQVNQHGLVLLDRIKSHSGNSVAYRVQVLMYTLL